MYMFNCNLLNMRAMWIWIWKLRFFLFDEASFTILNALQRVPDWIEQKDTRQIYSVDHQKEFTIDSRLLSRLGLRLTQSHSIGPPIRTWRRDQSEIHAVC